MVSIKVILVSEEGTAREAYINALHELGVEVDVVSTFSEIYKSLTAHFYSGVMVDFKTKMKATGSERDLANDVLEQFPFVQLKFEEETGEIRSLYAGQTVGSGTLKSFIDEECRPIESRRIRLDTRNNIHFNVILSERQNGVEQEVDRTVTINASKGGCFIYSTCDLRIGSKLMMVFKELEDEKPIIGEVRWLKPWGEVMRIPGAGIRFDDICESQLSEICGTKRYE